MEKQISGILNPVNSEMKDEFDSFLSKVNEIGSIITEISSTDKNISKRGIERADKYLQSESAAEAEDGNKIVYNRTALNKNVIEEEKKAVSPNYMSTEEFMRTAEKDAKERYNRKKKSN